MRIEEMTDDQVLDWVFSMGVPKYLDQIKLHGRFSREKCVWQLLLSLRTFFYRSRGIGWSRESTEQDALDLHATMEHFTPLIRDRVGKVEAEYLKGQMETSIKNTVAGEILSAAFASAGLEVQAEYFRQKALVKVRLIGDEWTVFWVAYENMNKEGYLDGLVATAIGLRDSILRKHKKDDE